MDSEDSGEAVLVEEDRAAAGELRPPCLDVHAQSANYHLLA